MFWIRLACFVLTVSLSMVTGAAGTIYTWTGADGVRRYSNSPPPEGVDNVKTIDELQGDPAEEGRAREEFNRMVDEANRQADEQIADQEKAKARAAAAEENRKQNSLAERVAAERKALQAEIDSIAARALGPTFSAGQKAAMIKALQDKINRMVRDPEAYFGK
jgi:Skp family chaperone for outer membrane proteins